MSRDGITRVLAGVLLVLSIGAAIGFEQSFSQLEVGGWAMAALGFIAGVSVSLLSGGYTMVQRAEANARITFETVKKLFGGKSEGVV